MRTTPTATAFDLDELRNEHGRVVVRGRWSGTRGLRFVRPTLLVGDREVLATLDHKPWAPDAGVLWTAAFPWEGPAIEPGDAALAVTPAVTVPLVPGGRLEPELPAVAAPAAHVRDRETLDPAPAWEGTTAPSAALAVEDEPTPEATDPVPEFLPGEADEDRDLAAVRRRLEHAERERDEALAEQRRLRERADAAVGAERRAEADRDDALAERRRADGWAEQQNRHVAAVQRDAEQVIADREAALAAQRRAERERDDAVRQAAQAREARDETLVAYRALERRVRTGDDGPVTAERPAVPPTGVEGDDDEPLGVVAVPAARDLAPDVHHVDRITARSISTFDVWAVRILGSVAAVCFLGLMLLLALVFV